MNKCKNWHVNKNYSREIQEAFSDIDKVLSIKNGEVISTSSISQVIKYSVGNKCFYIKQYFSKGKHFRKYIGKPRYLAEYRNLQFCKTCNINVPSVAAYGEKKEWFGLKSRIGIIITEEVKDAHDLKTIAFHFPELIKNSYWRKEVIQIISSYVKQLHAKKFIHYDLQWRNILVTCSLTNPIVYFFDIPCGSQRNYLFHHGVKRDFYNLYKTAFKFISRTDQLRFYLLYKSQKTLTRNDKKLIKQILAYYRYKEYGDMKEHAVTNRKRSGD